MSTTSVTFDGRRPKNYHIVVVDLETTGLNPDDHEILQIGALKVDERTLAVIDAFEIKVKPQHIDTAEESALEINRYDPELWEREGVDPRNAALLFASWVASAGIYNSDVIVTDGGRSTRILKAKTHHVQFCGQFITGFDWPFLNKFFTENEIVLQAQVNPTKEGRWADDPESIHTDDDGKEYVLRDILPQESTRNLIDTKFAAAILRLAVGPQELKSTSLRPTARYCGFVHDKEAAHEAVYDCKATVHVLRWMKAALLTGAQEFKRREAEKAWQAVHQKFGDR